MALAYALLHPDKIELALQKGRSSYDEPLDMILGALGVASDLGAPAGQFLESRLKPFEGVLDKFKGWIEPSGPLGFLGGLFEGRVGVQDLPGLIDGFIQALGNGPSFKEALRSRLHAVIDALPDADSVHLAAYLREQFNDATGILEGPLKGGRQDAQAHRGFRSAVTMRQVFGPELEKVVSGAASFDIKAYLRQFLDDLLNRIDMPALENFSASLKGVYGRFGGLLHASVGLTASFSVSASAGGPQGMADKAPTLDDEAKPTPHPIGSALWWIDMITGIFTWFFMLWEIVRTGVDRAGLAAAQIIMLIWQTALVIVRAAAWKELNTLPEGVSWLFTDRGMLAINLFFRTLGSLYDAGDKKNWALAWAQSMLKFCSNIVNLRVIYWYVRSWLYFDLWKSDGKTKEVSLTRFFWAILGPMWVLSSLFGALVPAWEDFNLQDGIKQPRAMATLIVVLVVGLFVSYLLFRVMSGVIFDVKVAWDTINFCILAPAFVLTLVAGIIVLTSLRAGDTTMAQALFIVLMSLVGLFGVIGLWVIALAQVGWMNSFALHSLTISAALFLGGVLPYILWWYYCDDGRDKHKYFGRLDAATNCPYFLPFPKDDSWFCGQGMHGMFSHIYLAFPPTKSDNHYGYDFNTAQGDHALAARPGVVVNFNNQVPDNENPSALHSSTWWNEAANHVDVQHLSWVKGHDPGTDLERVLTRANYLHFMHERVWVDVGFRLEQGQHLADVDCTGVSALNHLHFHVREAQTGYELTLPVVFADQSLGRPRDFPFLIPLRYAFGDSNYVAGKPLSMAYYASDNPPPSLIPNRVRLLLTDAGTPAHHHFVDLDWRVLGKTAPALPPGLVTTEPEPAIAGTSVRNHVHTVTLSDLGQVLYLQTDNLTVVVSNADGHTHGFSRYDRRTTYGTSPAYSAPTWGVQIVNPPAGQLMATKPGPYRMLGDQLVVRVNGLATEYWLYGAQRAVVPASIALDRGLPAQASFNAAGTVPTSLPRTVLDSVAGLNRSLRASGAPFALRALPTIVIETRQRGRKRLAPGHVRRADAFGERFGRL